MCMWPCGLDEGACSFAFFTEFIRHSVPTSLSIPVLLSTTGQRAKGLLVDDCTGICVLSVLIAVFSSPYFRRQTGFLALTTSWPLKVEQYLLLQV